MRPIKLIRQIFNFFTKTRLRKVLSSILALLIVLTSFKFLFFSPKEVAAADIYLGFNEGYGTSTSDTNSTITATTITNSVWKSEDLCKVGKCLYFDGTGDYVSHADDANLDMGSGNTVTVEGWFRTPDITSGTRTLVAKEEATGADGGYRIDMNSSGFVVFGIDNDNDTFPSDSVTSTVSYDDNAWHHFAAVKDGSSSITLYIDGRADGTADTSPAADVSNDDSFYIGMYNGASNGWVGFIDEVKVLRTARTAAQVKADFTGETPSRGTSASFGGGSQSYLSDGLVGYWRMDESSGNVTDYSGNGLTLTNNGTTTFVVGKFGNGSEHVPASTQYFSTATTVSGVKSVSFWTNPDSTTNYFISLTSGAYITSSSGTISATGLTNSKIYVNGVETTTLTADTWQHVMVTFDSIDANQLYIGRQGSNYYDGTIDEVRIYNRTLSPAEVQKLYNWAPGPVGWWKMDEGTGTSVQDTSGNSLTATLTGGPIWTKGRLASGVQLDGSDDYLDVGTGPTAVNTVSFWIKPNTNSEHLLDLNGSAYISASSGTLSATGFTTPTYYINGALAASPTVSANTWTHVAVTTATALNASDFDIGRLEGTDYLAGTIDDTKLYNYARTSTQIIEDMNAGHPAPGSPVGSAVSEWRFDEGALNTCSGGVNDYCDSTSNANDLAFSTTTGGYTNSGRIGKALNGTNAVWASKADDSDFDVSDTDDYTISLWYKGDNATNPSTTEYLVNKANATTAGYAVYANSSDQLCFGIDDDTSWGPDIASCTTTDVYDTTWHHLIAVRDYTGTDKTYLYIDGVLKDSDSDSTTATLANGLSLYLADRDGTNNGDEFTGDLDDVKIFRSALTPSQVKLLYNQSQAAVMGAVSTDSSSNPSFSSNDSYCPPGQGTTCTAPVAEWKMDENTGTTVNDSSTNAKASTLTGSNWVLGKNGSALFFDGVDDLLSITSHTDFNASPQTWSFWVKTNGTWADNNSDPNGNAWVLGRADGFGSYRGAWLVSGKPGGGGYIESSIAIQAKNASTQVLDAIGTKTITDNKWHHVAAILNQANGAMNYLYIDGVLHATDTNDAAWSFNSQAIRLADSSDNWWEEFKGEIDQFRVYNYARTAAQIAWDYNQGTPITHYRFDESSWTNNCSTDTVYDSSPNANHGDSCPNGTGQTTPEIGKRNNAIHFDDSDDYVTVPDSSSLDLTSQISISAWVNTNANEADNVIVSKGTSYEVGIDASGNIYWYNGSSTADDASGKVQSGSWHHIVVTNDDTTATYYVDGVQTGTDAIGVGANNATALRIGYDGTNYFDGLIDEVKIYGYPLTAQQVKNDYNDGVIKFGQ